ncbi:UDP-glucose 4-epimerase GalE [archaeon]|nr:UDP-glucose 4-epimerase GalE [archaeon]|tara:strand:- start:615 stop:1583 length:969 start_codon:yes stop_codon:yes gene_type:complete
MKILLTGGAGYIGSHTTRLLLEKGYTPIVIDSLENGHKQALPSEVKFYNGKINNKELVNQIFKENNISSIIHFAGYIEAGESMKDPLKFFDNNVSQATSFLKQAIKNNVKKIVFSSTAAVYGIPKTSPITEHFPLIPINHYGWTKLFFERILDASSIYGLKSVCLRYFNAAGAGYNIGEDHSPESHLIPLILKTALKQRKDIKIFGTNYSTPDGTCIRDYIHVLDLAQAHIEALNLLEKGVTGKFNVGTGKGNSVKEVIDITKKITQTDFPVIETERRPGDPAELIASSDKLQKESSWKPKYDIKDIIKSAWQWHSNHPQGF